MASQAMIHSDTAEIHNLNHSGVSADIGVGVWPIGDYVYILTPLDDSVRYRIAVNLPERTRSGLVTAGEYPNPISFS